MMKKTSFLLLLILCQKLVFSQSPDWNDIRNHVSLIPENTSEFERPYLQPHHNDGWEDGVFISRDGLHMYSTYLPADLISVIPYLIANQPCPNFTPFIQQPLLGVDTITNSLGCSNFLHSDIVYATRTDTSQQFVWQPSNLANPVFWEGAVHTVQKQNGKLNIFSYSKSHSGGQDIFWIRDTVDNPTGPGIIMPDSVNSSSFSEDNPHIEIINDSLMVLMLDNHPDGKSTSDIFYCISTDNGNTWTQKKPLTSINTPNEDIHPHLWYNGIDWWLYYSSTDTLDAYKRLAIFRSKQMIANDFNSWSAREKVIGAGDVTNGTGAILALGEPTLTQWGDLSFVCIIMAVGTNDSTDKFQCDPWFMKRKDPITNIDKLSEIHLQFELFPNPAIDILNIKMSYPQQQCIVNIYNTQAIRIESLRYDKLDISNIDISDYPKGIYFIEINTLKQSLFKKFIKL